jgi:hypothetical protein
MKGPHAYSAFEPDLIFWVLATLIRAALSGFEFIYGELPVARKEAFYRDMCRFGIFFNVDESISPKDWNAFEAYYCGMVEGDLLGSHSMCRELARAVIYPRDSAGTRLLGWAWTFSRSRLCRLKSGAGLGCGLRFRAAFACGSLAPCCQKCSRSSPVVCDSTRSI